MCFSLSPPSLSLSHSLSALSLTLSHLPPSLSLSHSHSLCPPLLSHSIAPSFSLTLSHVPISITSLSFAPSLSLSDSLSLSPIYLYICLFLSLFISLPFSCLSPLSVFLPFISLHPYLRVGFTGRRPATDPRLVHHQRRQHKRYWRAGRGVGCQPRSVQTSGPATQTCHPLSLVKSHVWILPLYWLVPTMAFDLA